MTGSPCEKGGRDTGKKDELTARQRRFLEEYLSCGDAAEAALAAGYSSATAAAQGARLLRDPKIQRARREMEQRLFDAMGISSAWIGRRLVEIVNRCMQETPHLSRNPETKQREPDGNWEFDPAGAMRALHELDEHMRALRSDEREAEEEPLSFEEWIREQGGGKL
ncbi:MAG: terminase small subunit [Oscillospiraceae bacterium]|nr:terminase small subunit [Oscillospiraceae bacterium]